MLTMFTMVVIQKVHFTRESLISILSKAVASPLAIGNEARKDPSAVV